MFSFLKVKIQSNLYVVCNLGGNWPSTLALWSVDALTWKSCHSKDSIIHETNKCRNAAETLVSCHFS
jgi:PAT family acetyl-CoA transporter-like MFS transporter 1